LTDYESLNILFEEFFGKESLIAKAMVMSNLADVDILHEMELANQLKKDELWLLYNMHVDNLQRVPSKFLTDGFTTIVKRWNDD